MKDIITYNVTNAIDCRYSFLYGNSFLMLFNLVISKLLKQLQPMYL